MSDVIEHLDNPFLSLKLIEKNLNPNEFLFLQLLIWTLLYLKLWVKVPLDNANAQILFFKQNIKIFLNKFNLDIFKIQMDTRLISLEYLFYKFSILVSKLDFIFKFFLKFNSLKKKTIKINLFDLNIYFVKKIKKI